MDGQITKQRELNLLKTGLGEIVLAALYAPKTVEILLNADGALWVESLGEPMKHAGRMEPEKAESLIRTVAAILKTTITWDHPTLEGELPLDGSRFAAQLPPIVSAPTFAIRKKASAVFTLEQYEKEGIIPPGWCGWLWDAIAKHQNILVVGGTGSGKTTLVNALLAELARQFPNERVVILEDTNELQCSAINKVQFHTAENVSMTQLLRTTLRMRPDRIIVGEVRGPEALDLLDSWNTGHPGGISTLHANGVSQAFTRLVSLISRNPFCPRDPEYLIQQANPLIVFIERTPEGRRVTNVQHLCEN